MQLLFVVLLFHLELKMGLARVSRTKWHSHVILKPHNHK
jgi:hypothetical protein